MLVVLAFRHDYRPRADSRRSKRLAALASVRAWVEAKL